MLSYDFFAKIQDVTDCLQEIFDKYQITEKTAEEYLSLTKEELNWVCDYNRIMISYIPGEPVVKLKLAISDVYISQLYKDIYDDLFKIKAVIKKRVPGVELVINYSGNQTIVIIINDIKI